MRLLSFSRISGCTVSRPIATSSLPVNSSRNSRHLVPTSDGWHSTITRSNATHALSDCRVVFHAESLPSQKNFRCCIALFGERRTVGRGRNRICAGIDSGVNTLRECVLPQIAHQASPGTFAIREKHSGDGHHFASCRTLVLDKERIWSRRIDKISLRPTGNNPGIALRRFCRIRRRQGFPHEYKR